MCGASVYGIVVVGVLDVDFFWVDTQQRPVLLVKVSDLPDVLTLQDNVEVELVPEW